MKLFLDRHKTLLPRVDTIYLLTRIMALVGITWFGLFGDYATQENLLFQVLIGTFVVHLAVFYLAVIGKFDLKLAYFSAIIYDLILVPTVILYTGSVHSSFYLLFYLTISVAAYVLTFPYALTVAVLTVLSYLGAIYRDLSLDDVFDVSLRVGFILVYFLAITYASEHMRKSERRLLKLFNTLNKRTSELEKSQAQLEMIYENTRILASILDTDGVIREVVRIMGDVLQYRCFSLVIRDKRDNLFYRARLSNGRPNYHLKAIDLNRMDLLRKVSEGGEPVRLKDIALRDDFEPLSENTHAAMIVPLVSHGVTTGVLTAESKEVDKFREKDVQMLSIVARSAALALDNAELQKKTEELTIIDELTETYNYRYFVQKLEEEKRRASRYNLPLSLVRVDIDWFKKLNDTYGHEVGNKVLKGLSVIIKGCIRDVDIFARYGGEEFAIILPQTPLVEAHRIGERIRSQVESAAMDAGKEDTVSITVSVGISSFPENGHSQEELVSVADQALYRAKGEGRNQVCVI